jgi:hypothetical protein
VMISLLARSHTRIDFIFILWSSPSGDLHQEGVAKIKAIKIDKKVKRIMLPLCSWLHMGTYCKSGELGIFKIYMLKSYSSGLEIAKFCPKIRWQQASHLGHG